MAVRWLQPTGAILNRYFRRLRHFARLQAEVLRKLVGLSLPEPDEELEQLIDATVEEVSQRGLDEELSLFRDDLTRVLRNVRLAVLSGTIELGSLAVGQVAWVYVDHSDELCFVCYGEPELYPIEGVQVQLYLAADVSGQPRVTNGAGFVLRVENISAGPYSSDVRICWRRCGIAGRCPDLTGSDWADCTS